MHCHSYLLKGKESNSCCKIGESIDDWKMSVYCKPKKKKKQKAWLLDAEEFIY